ncbi:MAG: HDOD domain-containing protein [Rhizobacter sp.]|nr:HDOD domain-containing protein [Rhizobacter sp.]
MLTAAPSTSAAGHATGQLGRFELVRMLGQGAQATVWLARDARLERDVAIKLIRADAQSADEDESVAQWLQEARSVSRLTHPHIVPVFEADVHEGRPYLVFEYVAGPTLSEALRARRAPMPAREAVTLMVGVLDALQAAHAAGVVHRDLKPSNILVDAAGRARVMDFGIAARSTTRKEAAGVTHRIVGTPGYMSPEAARGEPPMPAMDIYAAGLVLAELLNGGALIREPDPHRAIHRALNEDIALPASMPAEVDDKLRTILLRAIARDASQRTPSAAAMREALHAWNLPAVAPAVGGGGTGALDFLLRKMRHKSDFPALSDAVIRIQRVASSENESLANLSAEILKDVALTNKLLRLVNTAHYAQVGGGSISTVSRAAALIGFAGIRNMALSLVLLEHMQDKAHASQLKAEFLRSQLAGSIANRLCGRSSGGEEAFIGALLQNLGRLLTQFYFPEEASQVEKVIAADPARVGEDVASIQVLGMSYEELGLGVARSWGLPDNLQRCMRKPRGDPPRNTLVHSADRLRWVTAAANEIAATLLDTEPDKADAQVRAVAQRYCGVLGTNVRQMVASANEAREDLAEMASAMGIAVPTGSAAHRLLAPAGPSAQTIACAPTIAAPRPQAAAASPDAPRVAADAKAGPAREGDAEGAGHASELMTAGIQDITNAMVESFKLNEVLRMVLETMLRALRLSRVVFCLRDPKTDVISGRFGLGHEVESVARAFRVAMQGETDLFAAVCRKGADTLITDAFAPQIARRLPAWYLQHVNAPAFLLLPLAIKGAPFALIYADRAQPGFDLSEKELSLLRTLRNQAVMAFRQAG